MAAGTLEEFQAQRGRIFGTAYRMLGSAAEADDVAQEAWLRWQGADHAAIKSVPAWLTKVTINLCLNQLASARVTREAYPGPWLPEPLPTNGQPLTPLDDTERGDSVAFALLHLMETLTPTERAAYVLREAFAYSHAEVADVIDVTEASARQLYSRAKSGLSGARTRRADPAEWRTLVARFLDAARNGNLDALEQLLSADVVAWSDGGGIVNAARRVLVGPPEVARYVLGVLQKFTEGLTPEFAEYNGQLALVGRADDAVRGIWFLDVDENGRLNELRLVVNPNKLRSTSADPSQI